MIPIPHLQLLSIPHLQLLLVAVALFPVAGVAALIWYLFRHRGKPGANWFMLSLVGVAAFCGSYGLSLLVFDPGTRATFEMVTIVAVCCIGPPFLSFGLEYTGRPDIVRNPLYGAIFAVPVLTIPIAATNASHGLLWSGFELDPLFGAATVQYTFGPWGFFAAIFSLGTAGLGALLLVGAILKYGPLYRAGGDGRRPQYNLPVRRRASVAVRRRPGPAAKPRADADDPASRSRRLCLRRHPHVRDEPDDTAGRRAKRPRRS